jgi:GTP-sensing pleiotropic transcriptional regulator CodY
MLEGMQIPKEAYYCVLHRNVKIKWKTRMKMIKPILNLGKRTGTLLLGKSAKGE